MKIKKLVTAFLTFLVILSISLLTISFSLKGILVNGVIKETIKSKITVSNYKEGNEIPMVTTNNEDVNKLLQSKEVQDLMNKYLDKIINNLSSDEEIDEYEIEKDVINFLKDNKEEIEKITGKEITEEQIEKTEELYRDNHISHSVEKALKEAKSGMTTRDKTVLKGYSFLISNTFRIIMFILIVINLVLISVINKSLLIWIEKLGTSMLFSGIITTLVGIVTGIVLRKNTGITSINTTSLITPSIMIAIFGLLTVIVYKLVKNRRSDQDALPEISEGE